MPYAGRRALVVEDNPTNLTLATALLTRTGFEVLRAEDALSGLSLLASSPVDVVLMDVQMPGMDGFEATAKIRSDSDPRIADVPVVAVTAHAMKGDAERCLAAGMDSYVAKPVDRNKLMDAIDAALRARSRVAEPSACRPEPSAARASVPVDLDRLAADTDWEFAVAHSQRYLEHVRDWVAAARTAAAQGNCAEAGRLAHKIRGGGAAMPFLVEAASQALAAARANDQPSLLDALHKVQRANDEAVGFLRKRLIRDSNSPPNG
jgi:CheY-like chemotaxis protein